MSDEQPYIPSEDELERNIAENIDKGEQAFSWYKGQALQRLSGRMTDHEALSLGHYDGLTNVTLNTIKTTEEGLNTLSSMPPERVPVKIKTSKGIRWADDNEAKEQSIIEGLPIIKIKDKWFFEYPAIEITDDSRYLMTDFIFNIARSSGALQGETKKEGLMAVSNIRTPPVFPSGGYMGSEWGSPANRPLDEDGE